MATEEKYTKKMNGEYLLDGSGNKIPLELWENTPNDRMTAIVEKIPEADIIARAKRLGIGEE